ncbi:MAG: twin-arginine translocase TatA/TatE family subunit [Thermoanaerobaculales bacterium]|nr:twin-arginine translocase TatA/TatE family subunit [Thermoanaerobaculales bacterium]
MFGSLGVPEIILIFVVALILFGPRQMPQIGKSIGKALGEFRRASNEFKRTIEDEVASHDLQDVRKDLEELGDIGREITSVKEKGMKELKNLALDKDPVDS